MRKSWIDLVILNGRPRHPQTQGLIERSNRTLEMVLGKWMQHHHTHNWSAGKCLFVLITSYYFDCSYSGLGPVAHSTNTSVVKVTNKTPFEIVFFDQRTRSDFEMWKTVCQSGVEDEENLPNDFIFELSECKFNITIFLLEKFSFVFKYIDVI